MDYKKKIKRNIILCRSLYGTDQAAALEESCLLNLVYMDPKIPFIIGKQEKYLSKDDKRLQKNKDIGFNFL